MKCLFRLRRDQRGLGGRQPSPIYPLWIPPHPLVVQGERPLEIPRGWAVLQTKYNPSPRAGVNRPEVHSVKTQLVCFPIPPPTLPRVLRAAALSQEGVRGFQGGLGGRLTSTWSLWAPCNGLHGVGPRGSGLRMQTKHCTFEQSIQQSPKSDTIFKIPDYFCATIEKYKLHTIII